MSHDCYYSRFSLCSSEKFISRTINQSFYCCQILTLTVQDIQYVCTTVEDILCSSWFCFLCNWSKSPGPGCKRCWRLRCSCPSGWTWLPVSAHRGAGWASEDQPNNTHITLHFTVLYFCIFVYIFLYISVTKRIFNLVCISVSYLYPWHLVFTYPGIDKTRLIQPRQPRLPVPWTHVCKHS